jgi:Isy1-like splicing family
MYKNITPDYYGYRDDDDGVLVEKEKIQEVSYL